MQTVRAWHATSATFDRFLPFSHFGSRAQAEMRRTRGGRLIEVEFRASKPKIIKDAGSWKDDQLRRLERQGFDCVQYLNRFEGIPLEAFERARAAFGDIDKLSDTAFHKALPEAATSWIVFDPYRVKIIDIVEPTDRSSLTINP